MSDPMSQERRHRYNKPFLITLFSSLLLVMLVSNYLGMLIKYDLPFYKIHVLVSRARLAEIILLSSCLLSGIGLFMVTRWGWWVFIFSGFLFIIHNLYWFLKVPATFTPGPVIQTTFIILSLLYFVKVDVFTPYMMINRRGWRRLKRYSVGIYVKINNEIHLLQNLSIGGFYVLWPDCNLTLNQEISVYFKLEGKEFSCRAGVASIVPNHGAGIAFRGTDRTFRSNLRSAIRSYKQKPFTFPEKLE